MSWFDITAWLDSLGQLHPAVILAAIGGLALLESAAFIGVLVPGETAVLLGGALAQQGHVNVALMVLVVALGATIGDSISYELGRVAGPWLTRSRLGRTIGEERLDAGTSYLQRRGARAVFFGRFVAIVRTVVPLLAGGSRMRYRNFLAWNVAGAVVWAVVHVSIGYFAGASIHHLESVLHSFGLVAAAGVGLGLAAMVVRHRTRALVPATEC
jgi:membrane protein DedA with SNARE-associated domain